LNDQTVFAPLLSVNEPEAEVVDILVELGQKISPGDLLCVLATTKANFDVEAEISGYIQRIFILPGQRIVAGAPIFEVVSQCPTVLEDGPPSALEAIPGEIPNDLRITQKARKLATEMGIDVSRLPNDTLITEAMVRKLAPISKPVAVDPFLPSPTVDPPFKAGTVLIYGAGGHAKKVIDLMRQSTQFDIAGVIADPKPSDPRLLGVKILGGSELLQSLHDQGIRLIINAVGSILNPCVRAEIFSRLAKYGYSFPAIVHRTAAIEPSAIIGDGVQVFGMAFIESGSKVGFGAIINAGAIVSHDCVIDKYAHITPGALLAGHVTVGTGALVGMGVTTFVNVNIGDWARIGNGARINADVPPGTIVPAGTTWPAK
jgi:sugar O-acyltransferase (sialic acid O-acetyltransferase NeuD family)